MDKVVLEQLEKRTKDRLVELRALLEDGVKLEELSAIQAEVESLSTQLEAIVKELSGVSDLESGEESPSDSSSNEDNTEDEQAKDEARNVEEKKKEVEKPSQDDDVEDKKEITEEERGLIMDKIGSALSTKNSHPAKRKEEEIRSAFANFVVGKIDEREARALGIEAGNGGVTVPEVIASEVISYAQEQNLLRKYGTIHKTKGDVKFPVLVKKMEANITATERGADGTEIPETEIEFSEVLLSPVEFDALATVTKKLLKMSGAPVEQIVIDELKKAYVRKEMEFMFNGDESGNENPGALVKKAVPYYETQTVNVEQDGWSQRLYAQLVKMKNQPVTEVLKKSMWIVNRSALTLLESMVDSTGRPLLHVDATDGVQYKLLGHKLDFTDAANRGTSGAPVFYFGDFKSFHIQDVVGSMELQKLVEQYARTNRVGFQIYNLLDGQLIYSAFEPSVYRYEIGLTAATDPNASGDDTQGGTTPDQGGTTPDQGDTTPTVEYRAVTTDDLIKNADNTDTLSIVDGVITNSTNLSYVDGQKKTAFLLPTDVSEMTFRLVDNVQRWMIIGADQSGDNVTIAGFGTSGNSFNIANAKLTNAGTISAVTNNPTFTTTPYTRTYEGSYSTTMTIKVINSDAQVKFQFATDLNPETFVDWYILDKTKIPTTTQSYPSRLGFVGGISTAEKSLNTFVKDLKIKKA